MTDWDWSPDSSPTTKKSKGKAAVSIPKPKEANRDMDQQLTSRNTREGGAGRPVSKPPMQSRDTRGGIGKRKRLSEEDEHVAKVRRGEHRGNKMKDIIYVSSTDEEGMLCYGSSVGPSEVEYMLDKSMSEVEESADEE